LFGLYDSDSDNSLDLNKLAVLLQEIGNKIIALPATMQVASQQLSKIAQRCKVLKANGLRP
ncbi:hypothetical protein OH77DRAFT_1584126, partial [Trametes cingulata]